MKLASFLFGIAIFSIVTTMMFSAVQTMLSDNKVGDPSEWKELAGEYEKFSSSISTDKNSTTRSIQRQSELGKVGKDDPSTFLVTGAISGGKLTTNFYTNFKQVMEKISVDTTEYIDNRIIAVILALASIFLVLVALHFLRGFKTET